MDSTFARLHGVRPPPLWSYFALAASAVAGFAIALPFGPDALPDIAIEGLYLLLAAVIAVPVRRLDVPLLEIGWLVFIIGRLIDFLDELFVEPEPLVEPYFSGLFMLVSFSVLVAGTFAMLAEREDRIDDLRVKNEAIEAAPVGVTIADMTQEDEPLVFVNETFTEQTGYERSEATGRNCRFLQGDGTAPEAVDRMREAIGAGDAVQVTLRNYRKDGTPFWNQVSLAPIEDGDETHYYIGFQQDVTEREEYQRRLQSQRDDLDVLNQMVRHDIRNDLQVILAYVEVLEDHVDEAGLEHLDAVRASTRSAVEITETARELAETMLTDEGHTTTRPLAGTLRAQVDALRNGYEGIVVEVAEPLPGTGVVADDMLDSVFRNVLSNAIQHNDSPTPEVTVSATEDGDTATVAVADNGPGVPDELKDEIFGRGAKGPDSEGTGIGMYLVDTLVEKYGGRVWVEDGPDGGAVFKIELPTANTEPLLQT